MKKIPKIIHYVWVGGHEKNELAEKCIASWKKYCPDYEIMEWNEYTFDVDSNIQVKKALEEKNWAYASDIIRVFALKQYGGVYLDTDVELIANIDYLLNSSLFLSYESKYWLGSAVIGSSKDNEVINLISKRYDDLNQSAITFNTNALTVHAFSAALRFLYNLKPNGKTIFSKEYTVLSSDYFYPINYMSFKEKRSDNTLGIHRYKVVGTWHNKSQLRGFNFAKFSRKILGKNIFSIFEKMVANNYNKKLQKEFKQIVGNEK